MAPAPQTLPAAPAESSIASEAISFVYVGIWLYVFWLRTRVVSALVPPLVLFLSAIELLGPILHVVPGLEQLPTWARISVAASLLCSAGLLIYHHRRLTFRLSRHDAILSSIREVVQADGHFANLPPRIRVCRVLDALTFALGYSIRKFRFAATVLVGPTSGGQLKLLAQNSQSTFDTALELDSRGSAAGLMADDSTDALLYVPNTRRIHGVKVTLSQAYPERSYFRSMSIVAGAFQRLGGADQANVKSLLCVKIPTGRSRPAAVLNITADKACSMGYLEFSAAQVAAALLSKAIAETLDSDSRKIFYESF